MRLQYRSPLYDWVVAIVASVAFALALSVALSGCAVSTQNFADRSYMSDGMIEREIIGKNRTVAPPFGAKAIATHQLNMQESADFWDVQMGNTAELEGGDISAMINLVESILEKTALEPLVAPAP